MAMAAEISVTPNPPRKSQALPLMRVTSLMQRRYGFSLRCSAYGWQRINGTW
jgi:hypothetical protein